METSQPLRTPPSFDAIFQLIAALRAENGCSWDRAQTPRSMTVYLIEETYELVEAVIADDPEAIREEMGDVLFQLLFLLSIYQEDGRLALSEVLAENLDKMIRRHPHVFGSARADNAAQVKERWRQIKQQEKSVKGNPQRSLMDSVPPGMPALMRSYRISERAAAVGFDWDHLQDVLAQVESEWAEFKAELQLDPSGKPMDPNKTAMELGDVLFSMVNVARIAGIHPETALGRSTQKFIQRFKKMETMAADQNRRMEDFSREELENFWGVAKKSD